MKMEVLSVQNQYQGQYGVIGSSKVKDWASPLTPAPPPPPQQQQQQHNNSGKNHQQTNGAKQENTQSGGDGVDVVDGRQPTNYHYYHQQQPQQQQHINRIRHLQPINTAMEAAATTALEGASNARYSYNNNLLYAGSASEVTTPTDSAADIDIGTVAALHFDIGSPNDSVDAAAITKLSQRLQDELRAAKSRHLSGTEVTLPGDLTSRIAAEIIKTSEREPCGVRGCAIFIGFEEEPNNIRRFASFKLDADTVSTFELYLTLKLDKSGWTSLLPQFLKNLTRSSTILISPDFTLTKNKLYSCE